MSTNVLRMDPTHTTMLRRSFALHMRKKFRQIALSVQTKFESEQEFQSVWTMQSEEGVVKSFSHWADIEFTGILLEKDFRGHLWSDQYIQKGYEKGALRSYRDLHKMELIDDDPYAIGGQHRFLRALLGPMYGPQVVRNAKSGLALLFERVATELKGIASVLVQVMGRALAAALQREAPLSWAKKSMLDEMIVIGNRRALPMTATEVVRAHATGRLDAFRDLGVSHVGLVAEWTTSGSGVCPKCQDREGTRYPIEEAYGLIPLHPECKCDWTFVPNV